MSWERLAALALEVIVTPAAHREGESPAQALAGLDMLPAVQSGRLGTLAPDALTRPTPRVLDALRRW